MENWKGLKIELYWICVFIVFPCLNLISFANASPGQVGDPCLRSLDCSEGLCCARHFWTHICKPVLREGQVCTRHRRKGNHGLELFQRCPCDDGLSCQKLQEPRPGPSSKSTPALSEVEMPQLAAASSPSRHSSPHTSLLSNPKSLSAVAKTRLHVCQKNWRWIFRRTIGWRKGSSRGRVSCLFKLQRKWKGEYQARRPWGRGHLWGGVNNHTCLCLWDLLVSLC